MAISVILWALGSFGPNDKFSKAKEYVTQNNPNLSGEDLDHEISSYRLEHSFLGYLGMAIEPVVEPLGYDWKMGIGLISSFAAREVLWEQWQPYTALAMKWILKMKQPKQQY
ncbi:hypothetical protein KUH03_27920 [Sphingobacterium sp. E70]|uniref:nucleoside recognition domain-containing protein n=1 Tax=Sphingobacterium sp. E70 TaxID=2853439 RepID=UPI00211C4530|nr:nucleoside recognition domain-containing protein [Sphingobacterium sp. E70]ULT23051.1 hypothetical protein KUH03_27920 [Sphingobacterium sp. E70]